MSVWRGVYLLATGFYENTRVELIDRHAFTVHMVNVVLFLSTLLEAM